MTPPAFGTVVVIGGGCYGSFYTRQLRRALARGRVCYRRLVVVDRDPECQVGRDHPEGVELVVAEWDAFLDEYLPTAAPDDLVVPSPLMPHLFFDWLARRARARDPERPIQPRGLERRLGTPYETVAPDRTRYVSFADWLCPTHCIEPWTCPVTRGPRTWDMAEAVSAAAAPGPAVLFECRHVVFGVGAVPVRQILAGDAVVRTAAADGSAEVVIGTVSGCHGAVNVLSLGPPA